MIPIGPVLSARSMPSLGSRFVRRSTPHPLKVFMVCPGLGRVNRGFESFIRECYDALSEAPSLELSLFKGAGTGKSSAREHVIWNIPRKSALAARLVPPIDRLLYLLGKRIDAAYRYVDAPYFAEQASFFLALLPYVLRDDPDVIYFSDVHLGYLLASWKRLTNSSYELLFSNGIRSSKAVPPGAYVQQLAPHYEIQAIEAGLPEHRQSLVPLGFHIPGQLEVLTVAERAALRGRLGLPDDRPIVLSVALVDRSIKRMDYVIREVASLQNPAPYLLLVGEQDSESDAIISLGMDLLGSGRFGVHTAPKIEVGEYYRAADVFVLASLSEAFGRVLVEAMSFGLPTIAHDYPVAQYILEDEGYLADLRRPGELARSISACLPGAGDEVSMRARHYSVYQRFSWDTLRPQYLEMIARCAEHARERSAACAE